MGGPNLLKETNYLPQAIHYVKQHYQKPLFYFVSEDNEKMMKYLNKELDLESLIYAIPGLQTDQMNKNPDITKGIDLALLSMSDVAIMTYGSFGEYGALMTCDKDVYYPKFHLTNNKSRIHLGIKRFQGIPWNKTSG